MSLCVMIYILKDTIHVFIHFKYIINGLICDDIYFKDHFTKRALSVNIRCMFLRIVKAYIKLLSKLFFYLE